MSWTIAMSAAFPFANCAAKSSERRNDRQLRALTSLPNQRWSSSNDSLTSATGVLDHATAGNPHETIDTKTTNVPYRIVRLLREKGDERDPMNSKCDNIICDFK